jgi:hypothetical protein
MMEIFVGQEAYGIIRFPLSSDTISIAGRNFSLQNDKFSYFRGHTEPMASIGTSVERDFRIEHQAMR